jgi:hypothetical protein
MRAGLLFFVLLALNATAKAAEYTQSAPASAPVSAPISAPVSSPAPAAAPGEAPPSEPVARAQVLGLRADIGGAAGNGYGLGYLRTVEHRNPALWYWGYGVDALLITRDYRALEGALGYGVLRFVGGHAPPFAFEASLGGGAGVGGPLAAGRLGALVSGYFFELGYSFQFPIGSERPDWLATHQFSVRLNLPIVTRMLK